MKTRYAICMVALMVLLAGCALNGQQVTNKDLYLEARDQYNVMLSQYLKYYKEATVDEQAAFKETFNPLFHRGDDILDAWGLMLNTGQDPASQVELWIELKDQILDQLLKLGG